MTPVKNLLADTALIALSALKTAAPSWPFGSWWTGELIRKGELGCVRLGRRVFVTRALLDEYISARVVRP